MDILDELKAVTAKLDQEGIDYALCGGLAMAVYAMPRATLDIDILIQIDSLFRRQACRRTTGIHFERHPDEFHDGKIQIHRLCKIEPETGEEMVLDFLLTTPETAKAWESRQNIEWEGRKLKVVSPEGLILLKSFRRSGKDQDDIEYLRSITSET